MGLDPYGSHMSVLMRHALLASSVAELGMGWYSTPLLATLADARNTTLQSFETDEEWYKNFINLGSKNVEIFHLGQWDYFGIGHADLIFLDNSELVKDRYKRWPYLATLCDTLIMHDANHVPPVVSECFKYHKVYQEMPGPPTIVASHYQL